MTRKALLVGINYRGSSAELNGCINDVNSVKAFLLTKGYSERNITVMTDDTATKPTRANILKALMELLTSGASRLYFHYSGHGSYTYDYSGDEKDRRDETLVPLDYRSAGLITDDELRGVLECIQTNQKLFCVLDCCHSGTGMDLAYGLYERYTGGSLRLVKDSNYSRTKGSVIMCSGCLDKQYSSDAFIGQKYQGAMTWGFLQAVKEARTWEQLIHKIRALLKQHGYSQVPNLTSGRHISLRAQVVI